MKQFRVQLPDGRKILVDIDSMNVSVSRMRKNIADILNMAENAIRLYYKSKELKGRLSDYSFTERTAIPINLSFAVIPLHNNMISLNALDEMVFGTTSHVKFTNADKRKWVQTRSAIINWWVQILTFQDFIKEFVDPSYFEDADAFQSILEQFVDEAVSRLEKIVFRYNNGHLNRENFSCLAFAVLGSVIEDFSGVDDLLQELAFWMPVCDRKFLRLIMTQARSKISKKQTRVVSPKLSSSDPDDLLKLADLKKKAKKNTQPLSKAIQQLQSLNDWQNVSNKLKTLHKKQVRVVSPKSKTTRAMSPTIQHRHNELLKLAARARETHIVDDEDSDEYIKMRRKQIEEKKSKKSSRKIMKALKSRFNNE